MYQIKTVVYNIHRYMNIVYSIHCSYINVLQNTRHINLVYSLHRYMNIVYSIDMYINVVYSIHMVNECSVQYTNGT